MRFPMTIVLGASMIPDRGSLMKSVETNGRVSKPRIPSREPSLAASKASLTSSTVTDFSTVKTASTSDALSNGTLTAMPSRRPSSSG